MKDLNSDDGLDAELQELLIELLDGTLDDDGRQRLNARLSNDAAAQNVYLDFCETHAALAWEHGFVVAGVAPSPQRQVRADSRGRRWIAVAAIFAGLAVSLVCLLWWNSGDGRLAFDQNTAKPGGESDSSLHAGAAKVSKSDERDRGPVVAQFVSRIDAVMTLDSAAWPEHDIQEDAIRVGRYEVEQGLIQFRFASGVTVFIEAPAAFDVISDTKLALHSGRMSANVPPAGAGFSVETPEADVVDFGTEFSIEVSGGESEVHVFKGHVQVQPRTDNVARRNQLIDLRTEQAIRIADSNRQPVGIDLATDRFIRSIDEPQKEYPRVVKQLKPVANYRMPIKQRGLVCIPSKYDGRVLTGKGSRPACAPGVIGGSLRVGGKSIGRGGVVDHTLPLTTGKFTLSCWIYATGRPQGATVVTDIHGQQGRFSLALDREIGMLVATIRDDQQQSTSCQDIERLSLGKWHHIVMTCDAETLVLYRNGRIVSSVQCSAMSSAKAPRLWIGTAGEARDGLAGAGLWEGRIDQMALFDKSVSPEQVERLYEAGTER